MRYPTVGLIGKSDHQGTLTSIQTLVDYLLKQGTKILIANGIAPEITQGVERCDLDEIGEQAQLAIVVGGDGNMLGAARTLAKYDIHVVGVNRGKLGFLTDISPDEIEKQIDTLFLGKRRVEDRFLLQVEIKRDNSTVHKSTALNEVVLHHGQVAHMMEFEIYLDGTFVSSQRADGMIVATPTGSTAYSLSGGGPIIVPSLNALTLVPMFPHTLSSRPIVINADSKLRMCVSADNSESLQVSCDSHIELSIQPGDEVFIEKCESTLRLIHPDSYDYFTVLRKKLNWGK